MQEDALNSLKKNTARKLGSGAEESRSRVEVDRDRGAAKVQRAIFQRIQWRSVRSNLFAYLCARFDLWLAIE